MFPSHSSGVENAEFSWSPLIQPYPTEGAAGLHTLALPAHSESPAHWAVASWRRQAYESVLLRQIQPIFMIMSSCQYSTSGKKAWPLHVQVENQDCKMILRKLQSSAGSSGVWSPSQRQEKIAALIPVNLSYSPVTPKLSRTRALGFWSQATVCHLSVQRVRNKGKLALFTKTPAWLGAEHLRLHPALL